MKEKQLKSQLQRLGDGSMVQCLLCKHEGVSLDLHTLVKKVGGVLSHLEFWCSGCRLGIQGQLAG